MHKMDEMWELLFLAVKSGLLVITSLACLLMRPVKAGVCALSDLFEWGHRQTKEWEPTVPDVLRLTPDEVD